MTARFKSFRAVLGQISGGIKKPSLLESLREYPKSFRRIFGRLAFGVAFGIAFGPAMAGTTVVASARSPSGWLFRGAARVGFLSTQTPNKFEKTGSENKFWETDFRLRDVRHETCEDTFLGCCCCWSCCWSCCCCFCCC